MHNERRVYFKAIKRLIETPKHQQMMRGNPQRELLKMVGDESPSKESKTHGHHVDVDVASRRRRI